MLIIIIVVRTSEMNDDPS